MSDCLRFLSYAKEKEHFYINDLYLPCGVKTRLHTHDFYECYVILSGEFTECLNGEYSVLKKGMLRLIRPSDSHFYLGKHPKEVSCLRNIAIEKEYFERTTKEKGLFSDQLFHEVLLDRTILDEILYKTQLSLAPSYREQSFEAMITDILVELLIHQNTKDDRIPQWLSQALKEYEKTAGFLEGIHQLSVISGRTQEHINRCFQKYMKETPTRYTNRLRLEYAENLLISSNLPIAQVAFESGFSQISQFNRLFKERNDQTPLTYRNQHDKFFKISK